MAHYDSLANLQPPVPLLLQTRRRQYSSCDECRRSRVACDASKLLHPRQRNQLSRGDILSYSSVRVQCTNCSKRGDSCTFEWIRHRATKSSVPSSVIRTLRRLSPISPSVQGTPPRDAQGSASVDIDNARFDDHLIRRGNPVLSPPSVTYEEFPAAASSRLSRQVEAAKLHEQLWTAFNEIFQPVLSLWIGPECSPFTVPDHMCGVSITDLVVSLDQADCTCHSRDSGSLSSELRRSVCPKCNRFVQLALVSSIHAFSLRWLPLMTSMAVDRQQLVSLGERLWQNARSRIMAIIDKVSYKSILALYLFGLTPVYQSGTNKDDRPGVIGEVAVDVALRQLHRLRVRRHDLQFSGADITSSIPDSQGSPVSATTNFNEDFIHAENMVYWAGVVFDTSASMTRGRPSVLCSGALGFSEEPVFRLINSRAHVFHERSEDWRLNGFIPTNGTSLTIIHQASAWKGYVWKTIAALREAINYGYEESIVAAIQKAVNDALNRFDQTFRPLLVVCEKHILFRDRDVRLCYYLLQMHYNMGLLLLCSLVSSVDREDLVSNFETVRSEAVHSILTNVSFGLNFQVPLHRGPQSNISKLTSLLSLDPYPHHVLVSLELSTDLLLLYLERGLMSREAVETSCRVVLDGLEELPCCSESIRLGKKALHNKLSARNIDLTNLQGSSDTQSLELTRCGEDYDQETPCEYRSNNNWDSFGGVRNERAAPSDCLTLYDVALTSDIENAGFSALSESLFGKAGSLLSSIVM